MLACAVAITAGRMSQRSHVAASGAPAAAAAAAYADWPTYHGTNYRHGESTTMPAASGTPQVVAKLALDGAVYGSPIIIRGWTILATENNTVYAFDAAYRLALDESSGRTVPRIGQRPCGNIDPLGITGTPAYSPATQFVYVAPEFSGSPPTHQLYGLYIGTGTVRFHRSLDLPGVDPTAMQERGALLVDASPGFRPVRWPRRGLWRVQGPSRRLLRQGHRKPDFLHGPDDSRGGHVDATGGGR